VTALLQLASVSVRFGGLQALSDVSFAMSAGEIVAVIGPNGAGKTSLFNVITGYVLPQTGTISLSGRRIDGLTPHAIAALGVRRTFQNGGLFAELSVLENVLAGLHARTGGSLAARALGLPGARRQERDAVEEAMRLLDIFGIRHLAGQRGGELSGGQQRMVEIVRALATDPPLLLLDEPAVGLSPAARGQLSATIRRLAREGLGVLLIEHAIELVMSVADRILVLNYGQAIADGPPEAIRADKQVLEAYLGHG
jgi:branched-chain amino acid transport system ATP-binding protein